MPSRSGSAVLHATLESTPRWYWKVGSSAQWYSYGRKPVLSPHLSPVLANIGDQHLIAGVGWQADRYLQRGVALAYLLPNKVTYDNPELPSGPDAGVRVSHVAVRLGLSWRL